MLTPLDIASFGLLTPICLYAIGALSCKALNRSLLTFLIEVQVLRSSRCITNFCSLASALILLHNGLLILLVQLLLQRTGKSVCSDTGVPGSFLEGRALNAIILVDEGSILLHFCGISHNKILQEALMNLVFGIEWTANDR